MRAAPAERAAAAHQAAFDADTYDPAERKVAFDAVVVAFKVELAAYDAECEAWERGAREALGAEQVREAREAEAPTAEQQCVTPQAAGRRANPRSQRPRPSREPGSSDPRPSAPRQAPSSSTRDRSTPDRTRASQAQTARAEGGGGGGGGDRQPRRQRPGTGTPGKVALPQPESSRQRVLTPPGADYNDGIVVGIGTGGIISGGGSTAAGGGGDRQPRRRQQPGTGTPGKDALPQPGRSRQRVLSPRVGCNGGIDTGGISGGGSSAAGDDDGTGFFPFAGPVESRDLTRRLPGGPYAHQLVGGERCCALDAQGNRIARNDRLYHVRSRAPPRCAPRVPRVADAMLPT